MVEKMKITAKTVEEALNKAQNIWKIDARTNGYTVIQEPSRGIFGLGSKDAIIEVNKTLPQEEPEETLPQEEIKAPVVEKVEEKAVPEMTTEVVVEEAEPAEETTVIVEELAKDTVEEATKAAYELEGASAEDIGLAFLAPILKALDADVVITVNETADSIRFEAVGEGAGILIGRHGETLNAIQFLLSLVVNGRIEGHKGVIFDVENYRNRQAKKLEDIAKRMADKCKKTHRRVTLNPMNAAERRIIHITLEKIDGVTSYSEGNEPNRRIVIVEE